MPVDSVIFATASVSVPDEELVRLTSDLFIEFRNELYHDPDGFAMRRPTEDCQHLSDEFPLTACILQFSMNTPYYGPGYERGEWPKIAAVLEFLRRRLRPAQIWYGRDDMGRLQEVTAEFLDQMWEHWAENGGRPYHAKRNEPA